LLIGDPPAAPVPVQAGHLLTGGFPDGTLEASSDLNAPMEGELSTDFALKRFVFI